MPENPTPRPTVVPYAKAYGVDNINAQDALKTAAIVTLDEALADIDSVMLGFHIEETDPERYRRIKKGGGFEPIHVDALPERYAAEYHDIHFLRNWMVTISIVGWKLAQATPLPLTNVAEELALYTIIQEAEAHLELHEVDDQGATEAVRDLLEDAYEDNDFLTLYDDDLPEPETQATMGFTPIEFAYWFEAFSAPEHRGVVHPFILDGGPA